MITEYMRELAEEIRVLVEVEPSSSAFGVITRMARLGAICAKGYELSKEVIKQGIYEAALKRAHTK